MRFLIVTIFMFTLFACSLHAQDMAIYNGHWEGTIENPEAFGFTVEIEGLHSENPVFKISNGGVIVVQPFAIKKAKPIQVAINGDLSFEGILSKNGKEINGFIKSGLLLYHLKLTKSKTGSFIGDWNILMVDALKSQSLYLSVENASGEDYQAYPFFGDDRFTGTWCTNFQKEKDSLFFSDFKTGLNFKGKLNPEKIELGAYLGNSPITLISLKRSQNEWEFGAFSTEGKVFPKGRLELKEMESLILKDTLQSTHAVIVSKKGKIIYENYFDGYNAHIPHDMRSASKSISSALVGIAKDKSLFRDVGQSIFDFLPKEYQRHKDGLKKDISIQSLLTMSSGLDAIDYGINANPKSPAVEDNYQMTTDWTETILSAPMIHRPNTEANYGSANPYLLGVAMDSMVSGPLELFMDNSLFVKLGISNYIIQTGIEGRPYYGGGMYLTPGDMLKFGELYLKNGKWKGEQILSENWIKESFHSYRVLENTIDKNPYGYLWWHHTYKIDEKSIVSFEARGAGGQYIFVLPELDTVVVITSGNYRNGKTKQPELILEKYILPFIAD